MEITKITYNDLWYKCKEALLLSMDIETLRNCKMEYVLVYRHNDDNIQTIVHDRNDLPNSFKKSLKLAPNDFIIAKIDKYTIPEKLILAKDYDEFVFNVLKDDEMEGLYQKVIQKMKNGYNGIEFLFKYPYLNQLITRDYENYCKREFIAQKLDEFTTNFLNETLKALKIEIKTELKPVTT